MSEVPVEVLSAKVKWLTHPPITPEHMSLLAPAVRAAPFPCELVKVDQGADFANIEIRFQGAVSGALQTGTEFELVQHVGHRRQAVAAVGQITGVVNT